MEKYIKDRPAGKVLDVGAQVVDGQKLSYRDFFEDLGWEYVGFDVVEGKNVDVVSADPTDIPLSDDSFDLIISGQAFEHIKFFWLTFEEMARVLKPEGLCFLIAPSRGPEHKYPLDCWRFYPDGYQALGEWAKLELLEVSTDWELDSEIDGAEWGDTVGVFEKPYQVHSPKDKENHLSSLREKGLIPVAAEQTMSRAVLSFLAADDPTYSAWSGHCLFAHWITHALSPSVLVELGTHWGTSYFSFCAAVKDGNLSCECHAVDHWGGDSHAGLYGEHVFDHVQSANAEFNEFSSLHRMSFDSALDQFEDGSIDLLHIDGCHKYDSVRKDFYTWLTKMSSKGIVLFHDISETQEGFGVKRFWEELCTEYKHFSFTHSSGLGVLAAGNIVEELQPLFEHSDQSDEAQVVRDYFLGVSGELCQPSVPAMAQLYLDTGHGFTSREVFTTPIISGVAEYQFDSLSVGQLRFDPCDCPCVVTLKEVAVRGVDGICQPVIPVSSNACFVEGNTYYFSTFDPQIIFDIRYTVSGVKVLCDVQIVSTRGVQILIGVLAGQAKRKKAESEQAKAESEQAKAESEQAKAESEQAKAESEQAKAELEQAKAELEQAKAESEQAKAELEQAKAELEQAKAESEQAKAESEQAKAEADLGMYAIWQQACAKICKMKSYPWRKHARLIKKSGLFDREYYLQNNSDVRSSKQDPLHHFVKNGWYEGRRPNANFDSESLLSG
ncbi:class I SAM-dependent methyltransferase [Pseudodesulfovibrio profundus]|nr:class I SAM-dependent methyltransferase [Pseudodesulfovibrio profundus]